MRKRNLSQAVGIFILGIFCLVSTTTAIGTGDKIPVTTASKSALEKFLQGRDLFERLQAQEALPYFQAAVTEDADFAMAHLFLAFSVPSAKQFFEALNKAVALADKASEGERFWILGIQAGANGLPMLQREYYQKLIALYPNDERAHNLLGTNYFGQQEWQSAIESYQKATQINPNYSQPYNQLGYAYRFLEDYPNAEKAFQKYIKLIPNDPNPYDSYAELLMKMGKFEKSIEFYKKALAINPNFVASHIGIASDLNFLGKYAEARKQLQTLLEMARNDGERRAAHFALAVSFADEGNLSQALAECDQQYALAEKINDAAAMAGDLINKGNILLESGQFDLSQLMFDKAEKLFQTSDLSAEVKENARRVFLYNSARVAIKARNVEKAKSNAQAFLDAVKTLNNPLQLMLYHELMGCLALTQKEFGIAVGQLGQANLQNPYNLYRLALAYKGKGDAVNEKSYCQRAANFNGLNSLNQAFIRTKAGKMLAEM